MAQKVCVLLSSADCARLEAVVADRNRPQNNVWRARIILHSAERVSVAEIARRAGVSSPAVWRWQLRLFEEDVDGLLRDKTRPPGKAPLSATTVHRVVVLECSESPGEATHWTGRAVAKAVGISLRSVQRILAAQGLQPHRVRTFKRSSDPKFADKLKDIVGLCMRMHPPAHAVVLSVDEKSRIQALDHTLPGLPLKPGRYGPMTRDYKRHATTTLFVERDVPVGKLVHVILDNYGTHKDP